MTNRKITVERIDDVNVPFGFTVTRVVDHEAGVVTIITVKSGGGEVAQTSYALPRPE